MKYIYAILLLLSFSSCWHGCDGNDVVQEKCIITNVQQYGDSQSLYSIARSCGRVNSLNAEDPKFLAKKGLYNVGDTVKFTK